MYIPQMLSATISNSLEYLSNPDNISNIILSCKRDNIYFDPSKFKILGYWFKPIITYDIIIILPIIICDNHVYIILNPYDVDQMKSVLSRIVIGADQKRYIDLYINNIVVPECISKRMKYNCEYCKYSKYTTKLECKLENDVAGKIDEKCKLDFIYDSSKVMLQINNQIKLINSKLKEEKND